MEKPKLWLNANDFELFLKNEFANKAISFYMRYKRCGLPYSGGWAEQPERLIEIIDILTPYDDLYHPPMF